MALVALLCLAPALAAPLTDAVQSDAGQAGDAPGTLADARALAGPGRYAGILLADDDADAYRIVLPRGTYLRGDLTGQGPFVLTLVDPDGIAVVSGTTAKVHTDKAGAWYFRVTAPVLGVPAASLYTLQVTRTLYAQDDGGTGMDAGWRVETAVPLARAGVVGNLTGSLADCADVWALDVTEGEGVSVRFEWFGFAALQFTPVMTGAMPFPVVRQGPTWRTLNATATENATWTFKTFYPTDQTNGCAGAIEYAASVGPLVPPPPPPDPLCSNGIDDDGDGFVDWPADPGCTSALDADEADALPACSNGIDDDLDGLIDWPLDPGCSDALDEDERDPPPPPPEPEIFNVLPAYTRPGREIVVYGANITGGTFEIGGVPASKRLGDLGSVYLRVPVLAPGRKDVVVSLDGRTDTLVNGTEVLAPADLAVASVVTRPPPAGPVAVDLPDATREIEVTIENLALNDSEAYILDVFVLGRGQPDLGGLDHVATFAETALVGLGERTRVVTWDASTSFGSFDVLVTVRSRFTAPATYAHVDADADNDRATATDWTLADPGVGVRV